MKAKSVTSLASREEQIEGVALKLFIRHGFRKVRMGDIAEACDLSRPSLYAVFPNKEAIFAAIVQRHTRANLASTEKQLKALKGVKARLECIFEVWIIEGYVMAAASENAAELSTCAPRFAPEATDLMWTAVESQIVETLRTDSKKQRDPAITELAHVLALAAKGTKAASNNLPELRRLIKGLIGMAFASLEKINS